MSIRLRDHFDRATLQRGTDYAWRAHVLSVEPLEDAALRARVSNGRGQSYRQRITLTDTVNGGQVEGLCSCPVGYNCKHVAAALIVWSEREAERPGLSRPVQGWLSRIRERATAPEEAKERHEEYPG